MSDVMICATCRKALHTMTTPEGVSLVHTEQDPADHEPVPVRPDAQWRGRCDFCSSPDASHVLPAEDFRMPDRPDRESYGDWAVCAGCARCIEADRWDVVERRALAPMVSALDGHDARALEVLDAYAASIHLLYAALREHVTGPLRSLDGEA